MVVYDGLNADAPECSCTCKPETQCPTALNWYNINAASCPLDPPSSNSGQINVGACQLANAIPTHGVSLSQATPSCDPTVTPNVPIATWSVSNRLCSGANSAGQCENAGDQCLPDEGVSLCIEQAGDLDCPSAYPAKHLYFTGVDDQRKCPDSCPCSTSGTFSCKAGFRWFSSLSCNGAGTNMTVNTGGWHCLGGAQAVMLDSMTVTSTGTCTPGTAVGSGTATPKDPHTVCCAE